MFIIFSAAIICRLRLDGSWDPENLDKYNYNVNCIRRIKSGWRSRVFFFFFNYTDAYKTIEYNMKQTLISRKYIFIITTESFG